MRGFSNPAPLTVAAKLVLSAGLIRTGAHSRPWAGCSWSSASPAGCSSGAGCCRRDQTNTLVYGPGGYQFTDFFKAGPPISLSLWALSTLLIPVLWPF